MRNLFLQWHLILLLTIAAIIVLSNFSGISQLLHPVRVDSLYIKTSEEKYIKQNLKDNRSSLRFPYNPGQLDMKYMSFAITTEDSLTLKGWYIPAREKEAYTLLLIHDFNESKITLLDVAKGFYDRGFNLCLVDLRAHGESEGEKSTLGFLEARDINTILDSLEKKIKLSGLAVLGMGMGAAIAIKSASMDTSKRIKVIVLQSTFNNLPKYIELYSEDKWGLISKVFYSVMLRQLQYQLGYNLENMNITKMAKKIDRPMLFIVGNKDEVIPYKYSREVYDSSSSFKKDFWLVNGATHYTIKEIAEEEYFNKISVFVISSMPKRIKKTKFKRLAYYDK